MREKVIYKDGKIFGVIFLYEVNKTNRYNFPQLKRTLVGWGWKKRFIYDGWELETEKYIFMGRNILYVLLSIIKKNN